MMAAITITGITTTRTTMVPPTVTASRPTIMSTPLKNPLATMPGTAPTVSRRCTTARGSLACMHPG